MYFYEDLFDTVMIFVYTILNIFKYIPCFNLIGDEDRATRRVSYLKATWSERMHVDSDLELSDSEPVHIHRR